MDKIKEIFQLIKEEKYEEAVVQGIKYFQIEFSQNGMELVVPKQSHIWQVD